MATGENLMGAGIPPVAAGILGDDSQDLIAATGNTQTAAKALVAKLCRVTTATAGTQNSVRLPNSDEFQGKELVVINNTVVTLNVYPALGQKINLGTPNAPFTMAGNTIKVFYKISRGDWAVR
jgi:hypothetical protein